MREAVRLAADRGDGASNWAIWRSSSRTGPASGPVAGQQLVALDAEGHQPIARAVSSTSR
jgi:hypothetical protein